MNEFNYQTVSGDELELNISQLDLNTIEIDVSNLNYKDNRYTAIKYILLLLLLLGGVSVFKSIILNLTLIAFITIRCYFFTLLVKNGKIIIFLILRNEPKELIEFVEKITVTRDFGVQLTTVFAFDRTNSTFIQCAHIHDVVITEVIQDVR